MANLNDWIIKCDICGKDYDIHEKIPSNFDKINNREQLVLKASPKCPFCHAINRNMPRWK